MTNYDALQLLIEWAAEDKLSHEELTEHFDVMLAFELLGGDPTEVCCYGDYFIENMYDLPQEFYDPAQDDEKPEYADWQEYCRETNASLIDALLEKFGLLPDSSFTYEGGEEVIVRRPAAEHVHGKASVYLATHHDEGDEDDDHTYEHTTAEAAANDAVDLIRTIDEQETRTPTDLWRRKIAVQILQQI